MLTGSQVAERVLQVRDEKLLAYKLYLHLAIRPHPREMMKPNSQSGTPLNGASTQIRTFTESNV